MGGTVSNVAWLPSCLEQVHSVGYAVVPDVLTADRVQACRAALYRARERNLADIGADRLRASGEGGVVRLPMRDEPALYELLEVPALLAVVDGTVGDTAILHLQNGLILPPVDGGSEAPGSRFHRDFPRWLNGYVASMNVYFALDPFDRVNGALRVVPRSHQQPLPPPSAPEFADAVDISCRAGAMIVFDSTLWHAAGRNTSPADRVAVNHQFTRSFIKPQIDYVRALGDAAVLARPDRTQQILGWDTRVVTSLDEYYRGPEARLYRSGQG